MAGNDLIPEDEQGNVNNETDDLFQGPGAANIFAVPLVRIESITDEMTEGMVIDPRFLPEMTPVIGDISGVAPIVVNKTSDDPPTWEISINPETQPDGTCNQTIATTEFVCNAIQNACKNIGVDPQNPRKFNFKDCDGNPFTIEIPNLVDNGDKTYTWTLGNDSVTWDTNNPNLVDNSDGTYTWTLGNDSVVIKTDAASNPIDSAAVSCLTNATNVQEAFQEICDILQGIQDSLVSFVDNGDGTTTATLGGNSFSLQQPLTDGKGTKVGQDGTSVDLTCAGLPNFPAIPADTKVFACDAQGNPIVIPADAIGGECNNCEGCSIIKPWETISDALVSASCEDLYLGANLAGCDVKVKVSQLKACLSSAIIEEGAGVGVDGDTGIDVVETTLPDGSKAFTVSLDICELNATTQAAFEAAAGTSFAVCEDGESKKLPLNDAKKIFNPPLDVSKTVLTDSGTYTVPQDVSLLFVSLVGGGGGASGGRNLANPAYAPLGYISGGGGASGEFYSTFVKTSPGTSISYSVGAGGAGAYFAASADSLGARGGDTTFGSLSAAGGKGGRNHIGGNAVKYNLAGFADPGGNAYVDHATMQGGTGGCGASQPGGPQQNGNYNPLKGVGGMGPVIVNPNTAAGVIKGANGAPGVIVVWEIKNV